MPIHSEIQGRYELQSDGKTVWVNGPSGDNIGRFSERGIDIHHSVEIQLATGKVCALCKPGPCTLIDWYNFRTEMLNRYGVTIADKHMPRYLHV